ncbi:unnamed protein product [Euphydryas editha]|uniref:Uncharacterized protein n=1 Tax=Euphydryas editha TaxID=104508 RepID=A0AAU9UZ12_EUPED|nr:unnamed protein product [Euphydryas editha]
MEYKLNNNAILLRAGVPGVGPARRQRVARPVVDGEAAPPRAPPRPARSSTPRAQSALNRRRCVALARDCARDRSTRRTLPRSLPRDVLN